MDEDTFNMQIRKFLKNVGITSQREIEIAVRSAMDESRIKGNESLKARVSISIEAIGLNKEIDGTIDLE